MNKRRIAIISLLLIMVMAVGGVLAFMTDTADIRNTFTVGNVDITLDETKVDMYGIPVDKDGNSVTDPAQYVRTEEGNAYHLIPGKSYIKDPAVTVKAGSEMSYIRMIMTVTNADVLDKIMRANGISDYKLFLSGWSDEWIYHGCTADKEKDTISFEFRYNGSVSGYNDADGTKEDLMLAPLFKQLAIPGSVTSEQLAKLMGDFDFDGVTDEGRTPVEMHITAHAMQVTGFEGEIIEGMTPAEKAAELERAMDAAWAAFDAQVNDVPVTEPEDGETGSDDESGTGDDDGGENEEESGGKTEEDKETDPAEPQKN